MPRRRRGRSRVSSTSAHEEVPMGDGKYNAVVAQLVERLLAKEEVAGSNPVRRSKLQSAH